MRKRPSITRAYTRLYTDNGMTAWYIEWSDGSRTEGSAVDYHGVLIPAEQFGGALLDRAIREGITIEREIW